MMPCHSLLAPALLLLFFVLPPHPFWCLFGLFCVPLGVGLLFIIQYSLSRKERKINSSRALCWFFFCHAFSSRHPPPLPLPLPSPPPSISCQGLINDETDQGANPPILFKDLVPAQLLLLDHASRRKGKLLEE